MTTETRGVAIFVRPDVEAHNDPTRVIGRRTTCDSDEHPYLRGYEVVVVAVLKNALRVEEYDLLTTEDAVRAAGGVGRDDRIEVAPILPNEGLSFVTSDPKATDLKAWEHLRHHARHGAGTRRRGKRQRQGERA